VHIKFLDHGKGSAAQASAYVLDKLDHLGNVRAGVEVLRGDATTFNAFVMPVLTLEIHQWRDCMVKRRRSDRRADPRSFRRL
jgi:hypothetical protein